MSNVFEVGLKSASKSPSKAHACTVLPPFCIVHPSSIQSPDGATPTSSSNSILARVSKSSPSATSPFGIVQNPSSFLRKYGPPGCANNTSIPASRFRNMSKPALVRDRFIFARGGLWLLKGRWADRDTYPLGCQDQHRPT